MDDDAKKAFWKRTREQVDNTGDVSDIDTETGGTSASNSEPEEDTM